MNRRSLQAVLCGDQHAAGGAPTIVLTDQELADIVAYMKLLD